MARKKFHNSVDNQNCEKMKIPSVQTDRLRKLADLLISPEYDNYVFDVKKPEEIQEDGFVRTQLPVLAVAVSESIKVFPDEWEMLDDRIAYFKEDDLMNPCSSAMLFYGLDPFMFQHLFIPNCQNPLFFGGQHLDYVCSPKEIGQNIHAFVNKYISLMN